MTSLIRFSNLTKQNDSFSFLQWCGQYHISMKRLFVCPYFQETDDILTQETKMEKLATEACGKVFSKVRFHGTGSISEVYVQVYLRVLFHPNRF
jgi:hypothetical protein